MNNADYIEKLRSKSSDLALKHENLKRDIAEKQRAQCRYLAEIERINTEIEKLKEKAGKSRSKDEINVTDHAIVRYFERVIGLNIDEVKQKIITDEVLRLVTKLGGTGTLPNNNFKLVLEDWNVVTII